MQNLRNRKCQKHSSPKHEISNRSIIDLLTFLIMRKVSYMLTERFFQDPSENHFDKQSSSGAYKNNRSLYDFHYILSETKTYSSQYQQAM